MGSDLSNKNQFISIKKAAEMIGVTPLTLRNWDKNGKLKPLRHPINNYRVYKRENIEKLLQNIASNTQPLPPKPKRSSKRKLQVKHLLDNDAERGNEHIDADTDSSDDYILGPLQ